ncbi:MAG: polyphosphate kinase 2 family protein [Verrucomicrobiota bacterium]|nr:polyphosphate kinase 2 family protein [Verrucomicrobiota bacterium]
MSQKDSPNGAQLTPISRTQQTALTIIRPDTQVELAAIDPDAAARSSKRKGEKEAKKLAERLRELQQALYAEHTRSLLVVVQAMDTGGKDGAIAMLSAGLDLNGLHLTNFKFPSPEESEHDFLWRVHKATPAKGVTAIWNRSHYEDVLVPRVHEQISENEWQERCAAINAFERLLVRNGTRVLKFFLHISKEEQKERLAARLEEPHKLWKFNPDDLKERERWDDYQRAYDAVIDQTATEIAPWHVVSANRKWSRNLVMLETIVGALEEMNPQYPQASFDPESVAIA